MSSSFCVQEMCCYGRWLFFNSHFFSSCSYHSPPEGVRVALKVLLPVRPLHVLLAQVDKVAGEDEAEEADVQGSDQLLEMEGITGITKRQSVLSISIGFSYVRNVKLQTNPQHSS